MAAFEVLALDTATPQIRAPGAADTYTFPRAITPSGANVTPFTISGYSLTGANAQSLIDLSGTWNTTGTPTALKLNVTDTASNAASLLMDLQVGGGSKFSVRKDGLIGNTIGLGSLWINKPGTNSIVLYGAGTGNAWGVDVYSNISVNINSTLPLGWSTALYSASDLQLWRDAANTLAQRNGVNAQTLRVYNTFTDASNYERGRFSWVSNVLTIGTENAGTGTARALEIQTAGATRARFDTAGNAVINTAAIATNATDGFLYVAGCAGTPTGTPTAYTGRVPIVVDTTNNKLYFYSGGAWRDAGP